MSEDTLRKELYAANANRARIYHHVLNELKQAVGPEKAVEIMKQAIFKRGQEIGEKFKPYAPGDFEGLRDAFVGGIPDNGQMFAPTVNRCDANGLEVEFANCPLMNEWRAMGLPEADCAELCAVAREVDFGTFEQAGFTLHLTAAPEGSPTCILRIGKK